MARNEGSFEGQLGRSKPESLACKRLVNAVHFV
jgi:hypothetical protein